MALGDRPVRSIVRAVADAAARWSDADFPPRVRVLDAICERTRYSLPVVEYALDRLFFALTREAIEAAICDELGSLDALDVFVAKPGRGRARALPLGRTCVISSRTTIGVAIVPAAFALCAKNHVLVKDREDRLVSAFFETLHEELDEFAGAARAQTWDSATGAVSVESFDCIAAFGDDATLRAIRDASRVSTRCILYGSKASAGFVAREALCDAPAARALAAAAARDVVLYDTEGCLSLHALFVERGGAVAPGEFAGMLADAIERITIEFPPGPRAPEDAAAVAAARDLAAFRAASGSGAMRSDPAASYLTTLDAPADEPPPFLARTLPVRSVDSPGAALDYLRRHRVPLEALAVAGPARDDVANVAFALGASRIAPFGELQAPPLGTFHGGRPRIAEFVRWVSMDRDV